MFEKLRRVSGLFVLCGLILVLVCPAADSADFPKKPVRLIVTAGAGGGEDAEARGIAPFVEKHLGVSVVVENQVGAGGKIAFDRFQKSEPDGYSLITYTFPKSIIIEHMGKVEFKTKDFTPIYAWSRSNQLLVCHADTFKSFDEFLKAAKTRTLSGGLSGRGSTTHVAGLVAMEELGIKVNWVPYEGSAGSTAALAGKHIDFTLCLATSAVSLIKAGKLRPLLIFGDKRDPYMPDVPIPKDLNLDITPLPAIRCVESSPKTPASIAKVLEDAFAKAVKEPGFIEFAQKRQMVLHPMTSQELGKTVADTYPKIEKIMDELKK